MIIYQNTKNFSKACQNRVKLNPGLDISRKDPKHMVATRGGVGLP